MMFRSTFSSLHARFDASGLGAAMSPRRPRNPLLKLAIGLVGICVLALLVVVGLFVGAAMLTVGLLRRLLSKPATAGRDRVIDADYRVVRKPALPAAR